MYTNQVRFAGEQLMTGGIHFQYRNKNWEVKNLGVTGIITNFSGKFYYF